MAAVFLLAYVPFGPVRVGDGNTCFTDDAERLWCTLAYAPRLESLLGIQGWPLLLPLLAAAITFAALAKQRRL